MKVIDLGMAVRKDASVTRSNTPDGGVALFRGTFEFTAPEDLTWTTTCWNLH